MQTTTKHTLNAPGVLEQLPALPSWESMRSGTKVESFPEE